MHSFDVFGVNESNESKIALFYAFKVDCHSLTSCDIDQIVFYERNEVLSLKGYLFYNNLNISGNFKGFSYLILVKASIIINKHNEKSE